MKLEKPLKFNEISENECLMTECVCLYVFEGMLGGLLFH